MEIRNALLAALLIGLLSSPSQSTPIGELVGWGRNFEGQTNVPAGDDFVAMAGGGNHSLALKSDGSLAAWGSNAFGQTNVPAGNDFVAIAAGSSHNLALKSDGSLAGWGNNGDGATNVPTGNDFVAIAAGNAYSVALKSDGSLAGWGIDIFGTSDVPAGNDFVAIAAGSLFNLALKSDGSLAAWGYNDAGQTDVPAGNDFVAIAAGSSYGVALKSDGSLTGWGLNGDGATNVPTGNDFVAIAAGATHCLALKSDGSLTGWGSNSLGVSNVPAGNDFVAIAAGGQHSLAIGRTVPADVLVSNLAETIRDSTPIANPHYWAAQSFSTDDRPYTLTSIEAMIGNSDNSPAVVAELRRADVNNEIDLTGEGLVTTLTGPALTSGSPESQLFTPDGHVILESNTRYWLVLGSSNDGTFVWSYAEGSHFVGPGTLTDFADSSDAGVTWGYSIGPFNPYMIQVKVDEYSLPGDYNHNGTVDAADYVVWRKTFGLTGAGLAADGDGNLQVDDDDLVIWRSHFGDTAFPELGARASAAVPEPGSLVLLAAAASLLAMRREQLLR